MGARCHNAGHIRRRRRKKEKFNYYIQARGCPCKPTCRGVPSLPVQVGVEHDDGEGQDEGCVGVGERAGWVVPVVGHVALGERGDEAVHLLRLPRKPENK